LLVATVAAAAAIYLVPNIQGYSFTVFILGVPLAVINSVCEEILWRGTFIEVFKDRVIFSVIYPTMFFALYHIVPQLADPEVAIINA
jgi:membrane protease YdiL (CAAX protease family)